MEGAVCRRFRSPVAEVLPFRDDSKRGIACEMNLALRSALSLAIQARDVLWTHGSLVTANVRDTGVEVLLGADGNELRADALPVFRLSTDGEASDGNILDQEWDLSRIEGGIAPILGNHRLGQGMEFGLGNWRNARIVDVERVLPDGKKMPGRELHAEADYDMADRLPLASQARSAASICVRPRSGGAPGSACSAATCRRIIAGTARRRPTTVVPASRAT